jgi:CAAX amino terminal protease family.
MDENPVMLVMMLTMGGYFAWMWWGDLKEARAGRVMTGGLPGAMPASAKACWIAAGGAALILAAETWGEIALGVSEEQSKMSALFALYTLVAALVEEIIFRGYVGEWILRRGRAVLFAGTVGASVVFAAIHPFLWEWGDDGFVFTFTTKGWFSFGMVFAASLWFYTCRFASWNPTRSLLPCFAAHLTKNAGVIAIKAAQGFLVGIW